MSDDWLILDDMHAWKWRADERRTEREANPTLDVRAVLYGKPLLEHIAMGAQ